MLDELFRRTRELKSAAENYLCVEKMRDDLTAFDWYGENVMLLAESYSEWIGLDDSPNAVGCKAVLSEAIILREACGDVSVATCAETVESLLLAVGLVERRLAEVDVARKIQSNIKPESVELIETDVEILCYLESQPKVAKAQADIAEGAKVDRKTVGQRLEYLREVGYVKYPPKRKRGSLITNEGIKRLESLFPHSRKSSP